jgi:hypothetical protein
MNPGLSRIVLLNHMLLYNVTLGRNICYWIPELCLVLTFSSVNVQVLSK